MRMSGTGGRSPTCWGAAGSRTAAPAAARHPGPISAPGTTLNSPGVFSLCVWGVLFC